MIDVNCPQCHTVYHSREADVGKHILCTKCGSVISIVLPADRAVIQQPPAKPTAKSQSNRATKHQRIYVVAIAVVALAAVVTLVTLVTRHSSEPSQASQTAKSGEYQVVGEEDAPPNKQPSEGPKPEPRPSEYNSLPTGTRIEGDIGTGHGKLAVENGTDEDAVVQLSDVTTDQTVRWFFVKAHTTAHKARIPEGTYRLTFTTGLNWVESDDTFSWQPSYFEFEKTFDYKEQRDSEGVQFKEISVTLNPVLFGNVQTKSITRDEFLKGHRHVALQQ